MTTYNQNRQYQQYMYDERPALGDLVSDLTANASHLARQEIRLAKLEMQEKAKEASRSIALIGGGLALANAATIFVLAALTLVLGQTMELWLAALLVGLGAAVIGGLLAWSGINSLKNLDPLPEQTIDSLEENKEWLTRQMS